MILPISYIVLKLGAPPYSVFIVHFCVESVAQVSRMYMLRKLINLSMLMYLKNIYLPIVLVVTISIILPIFVHSCLDESIWRLLIVGTTCAFSVGLSVYLLGLTKTKDFFS